MGVGFPEEFIDPLTDPAHQPLGESATAPDERLGNRRLRKIREVIRPIAVTVVLVGVFVATTMVRRDHNPTHFREEVLGAAARTG